MHLNSTSYALHTNLKQQNEVILKESVTAALQEGNPLA